MRHSRLPSLSRAGGSEPSRFYPVPAKLIGNGTHHVSPQQNGEFEDAEKIAEFDMQRIQGIGGTLN